MMKKLIIHKLLPVLLLTATVLLPSCEKFFNPEQDILVDEGAIFKDWYEYRAVAMGMYGLQQDLAEQLFVLGELRGDLVNIRENAEAELVEIYNFNPTRENKYASPVNFFKLIASTNNLITKLEEFHPEVTDS